MPIDNLLERIQGDTARETAKIAAAAETEAAAIEKAAAAREESLYRQAVERNKALSEFEARKTVSTRETQLRREFLDERETLVKAVLDGLEDRLAALPASEESKLLADLLAHGATVISGGTITLSARTKELMNGRLAGWTVRLDEQVANGFLLASADGTRVADLTYPALVDTFWIARRIDVAAALFGPALRMDEGRA